MNIIEANIMIKSGLRAHNIMFCIVEFMNLSLTALFENI